MIKALVENGAQVLKPRVDGITALHLAAVTNDVFVLDYVLKTKQTNSVDMLSDAVRIL
jgi:ankyrin repeat protein